MSEITTQCLELPTQSASPEDYREFAKHLETWLEVVKLRHNEQEHGLAELRQVAARIIELQYLSKKVGKQVEESAELLRASVRRVDRLDTQNAGFTAHVRDARKRASMTRDMNLDGAILGPGFPHPPAQGEYREVMLQMVQQSAEDELKRRRQERRSSGDEEYDRGDERKRMRSTTTSDTAVAQSSSPVLTADRTSSSPSTFSPSRPHRTRKRTWKSIKQDEDEDQDESESPPPAKQRRSDQDPSETGINYRPSERPRDSCFCRPTGDMKSETSIFDVFATEDAKVIVEQLAAWDKRAAQAGHTEKYGVWTNGTKGRPICLRRTVARMGALKDSEKWACDKCVKKRMFCWARGEAGSKRIILLPLPESRRAKGLSMRDLDYWRIPAKA